MHPERCIYILGSEDSGLPRSVLERCQYVVSLESVLWDRVYGEKGERL